MKVKVITQLKRISFFVLIKKYTQQKTEIQNRNFNYSNFVSTHVLHITRTKVFLLLFFFVKQKSTLNNKIWTWNHNYTKNIKFALISSGALRRDVYKNYITKKLFYVFLNKIFFNNIPIDFSVYILRKLNPTTTHIYKSTAAASQV